LQTCSNRFRISRASGGGDSTNTSAAPDSTTAAFQALTATSVVFGAAALLLPDTLVQLITGGAATPLDLSFTRIAGGTMAISAAVEWSLAVG